ncbi:MAG: FtsW/RodA/SpoVE family cell cycle protein, partial [Candidatus Liptonbacteria bacterium]|nr:FtsW/RodA/SpoVE family cell cycle protein [Candidatus Liptonbacteria bacterium]
ARKFDEPFGRFLLVGFGSVIALQAIVNVGAMTDLMPLTGVPLPFVSFGGTALAVFLTMAGIAVNVTRYT